MGQRVECFLHDHAPPGFEGLVEILLDPGLAVRHERTAHMLHDVDEEGLAVSPRNAGAIVNVTVAVHPLTDSGVAKDLDGTPLEHTGADPGQDVGAGLALEHDALDSVQMEDLRKQKAGRPSADDRYLGLHRVTSRLVTCGPRCPPG